MMTTTPEQLDARRRVLLQKFAEDLVDAGHADPLEFRHIEAAEARAWHEGTTAPAPGSDRPLALLSEMLDYASDRDLWTLHRLTLRSLGELTLDDAAALRDVLRAILIDYALAEVRFELGSFIDRELVARNARLRGAA